MTGQCSPSTYDRRHAETYVRMQINELETGPVIVGQNVAMQACVRGGRQSDGCSAVVSAWNVW